MSQSAFNYSIRSNLPTGPQSAASIAEKFVETLDALSRIDPAIFANWKIMRLPSASPVPLTGVRSRMAPLVESNASRDDLDQPDPGSGGYTAIAYTGGVSDTRRMTFWVTAGGGYEAYTWLQGGDFDKPSDLAIVSYPLFKAALLAINAIWPPSWACAHAYGKDYDAVPLIPGTPLFPYSGFHIPWLAYLSAPLATRFVLPAPDIQIERTPDGGLLMIGAEERLDPTNAEHLRRARILAELMMARTGYPAG